MTAKQETYWIETHWLIEKSEIDDLQFKLSEMDCLGSYENLSMSSTEETPHTQTELIAYFPENISLNHLDKQFKALESHTKKLLGIKKIPQGNWATEWKKYFKPFALTKNIIICPSWEQYQVKSNEKVITLDPGMAFGTGQHDTTKFCAELICKLKEQHPHVRSLLDIGCGSGILSIIAKKIGFDTVMGVDIDPSSIETAQENLDKNPDAKPINFYLTDGSLNHSSLKTADVVVANIIAETLCELKDDLIKLLNHHGFLILSGILPEREDMVKKCFKYFKLLDQETSKDWHAYIYRK